MPRRPVDPSVDAETLRAYLGEIGKIPALTVEQERDLGARIRQGDDAALRQLVEGNLRFVVSYAKRYRGLGVAFLDLIHEGNLGLMEAARRFDPTRNVKFISYAVWWIRQALLHVLSDQSRIISVPAKLSGPASRLGRHLAALSTHLHRDPTTRELADDLEISEADASALMQIRGEDVSLSDRVGGTGSEDRREVEDVLEQVMVPAVDEALVHEAVVDQLRKAVAELGAKEREVMRLRFGLDGAEPKTLREVGSRLKLSRERVRQIESRAKERLRQSTRLRGVKSSLN
ncbi:MAG TPA: RNA polymerase sigma factor RpoD/SigA [Vicinamibacterales bacterium]|nr:RNA polymerase sigma factor RpoD/SigA [Vicinamibacterales bacterium]